MPQGTIVPFVTSSALFVRGLVAQCPPLAALPDLLPPAGSPHRNQCEWVLELILQKLPFLPGRGQVRPVAGARWAAVLARCEEPEVYAFAQRAIDVLIDLLSRPSRTVSRPAAS